MLTVSSPEVIGKTVWIRRRGDARLERVRVESVVDLSDGRVLVLGDLMYRLGGAYAEGDSRGRFNATMRADAVVEEVETADHVRRGQLAADELREVERMRRLVDDGIFTSVEIGDLS